MGAAQSCTYTPCSGLNPVPATVIDWPPANPPLGVALIFTVFFEGTSGFSGPGGVVSERNEMPVNESRLKSLAPPL